MSSYSKSHFPTGGLPAAAGDPGDREAPVVRVEATDQEVPDGQEKATDQEVPGGQEAAGDQGVLVGHTEAIDQGILAVRVEVADQEAPAVLAEVRDQRDLAEAGDQDLHASRDAIALFGLHVKKDTGTMAICKNYDYKDNRQIPFVQRGFVVE